MSIRIAHDKRSMANRTKEISHMLKFLEISPEVKSVTFFQYPGTNYEQKKPVTRIRITRQRKADRRSHQETFLLTIGKPNYAERDYIAKFRKEYDCWPADTYQNFPKKRVV